MSNGSIQGKQQLVQSLGQLCHQHLANVFKKFYPLANEHLSTLVAHANSNRLQALYMDMQRILRQHSVEIERMTIDTAVGYLMRLDITGERIPALVAADKTAPIDPALTTMRSRRSAADNLQLLGHDDLELIIALDNCSSRVREELRLELSEIEGRLISLLADNSLPSPLPLSPDALLEAFMGSLDSDMVATDVQLELLKLFDQLCFDTDYADMLNLAIDQLEQAGFEIVEKRDLASADSNRADGRDNDAKAVPEKEMVEAHKMPVEPLFQHAAEYPVQQPTQHPVSHPAAQSRVEEDSPAYVDEALIANTRIQTELLVKITSMLENTERDAQQASIERAQTSQVSASGSMQANSSRQRHRPCMDKPQLFAEINKHVNHLMAHSGELASNGQITRELAKAIKTLNQGGNGGRLHRHDASVFQVVENIFSSFGQSMVVAPEVQQVINRCEVPMLKLALKKPLILEQENHPIRRLFNEMAKYAIGLEQGDCEDNKIYQQMLTLSETMLAESFDEHNLAQILSEFMSFIDRDRHATSLAEEQEVERVAAQEKVNWARTRVEEEIAKRMVGKNHPQGVIDFVQRSWCVVLYMAHQRDGEGGADWQVGVKLLDNLLYLARRQPSDKDLKYRRELIRHIDMRLGHISTDIAQRSLQIEQLSEALGIAECPQQPAAVTEIAPVTRKWAKKITKFRKSGRQAEGKLVDEVTRVLMSAVKTELPGRNISQLVHDAETIDSVAQSRLMAMQKGCWIELGGDIKAHKRGKLAGIVGPSWKYVFVDNNGKLIAERDRARLAVDLLNGTVTVLDNSHLFDKAIKKAISQIKGLPVAS